MKVVAVLIVFSLGFGATNGLKCLFGINGLQSLYSKMTAEQLRRLESEMSIATRGEIKHVPTDDMITGLMAKKAPVSGFKVIAPRECEILQEGSLCSIAESEVQGIKITYRTCGLVNETCGMAHRSLPGQLKCSDCWKDHCNVIQGIKSYTRIGKRLYELKSSPSKNSISFIFVFTILYLI